MGPIDQRIYTNEIYGDAIVQVLLVPYAKLFAGGFGGGGGGGEYCGYC